MEDVEVNLEVTVGRLVVRFDDEYPDHAPEWVAARAVASIPSTERVRLLVDLLTSRIQERRRTKARVVEQRATLEENQRRSREERVAYVAKHRETCDKKHAVDSLADDGSYHACVACDRRRQKETPEGKAATAEWHQKRADNQQERAEAVAKEALRQADPAEYDRRYPSAWDLVVRAVSDYRDEVRLELTTELLGTSFALGDGRRTTWGAASADDHSQRIEILMQGVEGSARTMILHEKALEILEQRGARCLNDVRSVAA